MSIALQLAPIARQKLCYYFPILWLASIPLGVSIEAFGLCFAIIAIFQQQEIWPRYQQNLQAPWVYPLIAILIWTIVGCAWTPKIHHDTWFQLKKMSSFLLIPLLMLGFTSATQKKLALQGFLIASLIPLFMSIAKYFFSWHLHHNNDPGHLFYNHILTGFLTSYAAFIALEFWFCEKNPLYLFVFFLFSCQVLILNTGKMAYFLYAALIFFSCWQRSAKKYHFYLILLALASSAVMLVVSPTIHQMSLNLYHEILAFVQGNKATSFGFRVQFHAFAFTIFKQHWFIGAGPGAYTHLFKLINPVPAWPYAPNVHSQYWLILSEQGLIGFTLWGWFILKLTKMPMVNAFYQQLWHGLMLILLLNSFTDVIFFACPGYLMMAIAAIGFQVNKE